MRAIVLFFLISGMLTACNSVDENPKTKDAQLQIVSSIKPIHAIVLAIVGDHANTQQLIPDFVSPHHYNFKPSDIRKVKNADVIFRIDEHMETQLNGVFDGLPQSKLISLARIDGIKLLDADHSDHDFKNEATSASIDLHNKDLHIWTSPKNTVAIAGMVTSTLSELDSKNAKNYEKNFEVFSKTLADEAIKINSVLAKYQDKRYIVFHNSWQYFASEFGLQKPIVIDLHEGITSGAKTVRDIRAKIEKENIQCLFYDESINEARLKLFSEKIKTQKIDVLGNNIPQDHFIYINWLRELVKNVESCLSSL